MLLKIKNWYGRLGNNIIQIRNALSIAYYYNYNLQIPKHPFFEKTYFQINTKDNECSEIFLNTFFEIKGKDIFDKKCYSSNQEKVIETLIKNFKIKPIKSNLNELIIHIRSGDIFSTNPHPRYIPPPLSYYQYIIDKEDYDSVRIIAEDKKNPVIDELLKQYPKIIYEKNSIQKDVQIILSAHKIVKSVGTFIDSLVLINTNKPTVYHPASKNNITTTDNGVVYIGIECRDYHKIMSPWKNDEKQRKLLLEYKIIFIIATCTKNVSYMLKLENKFL